MKVIITGAAGYIGRHLAAHLAGKHEVFALDVVAPPAGIAEKCSCILSNLSQPLETDKLPPQIDVIFHLAQGLAPFPYGAGELFAVNTAATQQLLDYGRRAGARRFLLASTGDVYGDRQGVCRESDPAAPGSFYGATKYAAELLAQAYAPYLEACSLRLHRPYGPGQTNRLIPKLAERIQQGQPLQVNKGDRPGQSPTYIDDVVLAFERAMHSSYRGPLNVAGDEVVTMRELAEQIGRAVGKKPVIHDTGKESGDAVGDNRLMKEVLGAWPLVKLADGLARTFQNEGGAR